MLRSFSFKDLQLGEGKGVCFLDLVTDKHVYLFIEILETFYLLETIPLFSESNFFLVSYV